MCKMFTKILKYSAHCIIGDCWWHHWALLAVITGHRRRGGEWIGRWWPHQDHQHHQTSGPVRRNGHQGTVIIKIQPHTKKWKQVSAATGGVIASLMDVARCEILVWADMRWGNIVAGAIDQVTSWGQGLLSSNMDILQEFSIQVTTSGVQVYHIFIFSLTVCHDNNAFPGPCCLLFSLFWWFSRWEWESKLANIEALKSNGKQLASMWMMDDVWGLSASMLFCLGPGDSWSVIMWLLRTLRVILRVIRLLIGDPGPCHPLSRDLTQDKIRIALCQKIKRKT